jgi:Na+/H+ antiporter NhaD/arsenite permease-like protein
MRRALIGVAVAILLLVTHAFIEKHFHIPVSVAMAALIPALTLMVITPDHGKEVLRRIDLESIVFFIGLFVIVGGLEKSGVFQKLAQWILSHVHTQVGVLIVLVWFSAIMSAFVDNVPMAVAMAYLVKGLVTTPGAPAQGIMVWALAMGLQMGGNMTPIGGSPNVVAYAALERENVHIGWPKWILLTVPPTVVTLIFATLCVLLKHRMGWY